MSTESIPVRLTGPMCKAMPVGTELVGNEGYWKGASYVKTTPSTWAMFWNRPTPEQIWEAVGKRKNNLSPHPDGSAFVYEPPAKPDATPAPLDPSKVKAGDTVTLTKDSTGAEAKGTVDALYDAGGGALDVSISGFGPTFRTPGLWTLTDHQPAPEPEPVLPTRVGSVVLVRGMGGNRIALQLRPDTHRRVGWLHALGNPWIETIVRDHLIAVIFDAGESR